jgi:hypothetical protein
MRGKHRGVTAMITEGNEADHAMKPRDSDSRQKAVMKGAVRRRQMTRGFIIRKQILRSRGIFGMGWQQGS